MTENTHSFVEYKIQDIFYQFYTSGKTGVIKVFFPMNIVKTVYFSDGNIVFATSNSEKDKLTNILIKNKKITKEQLNMALKQMDKSISLGRNLVNMGLITHKELVWAVKIQVLSIVYSILVLKEGEYSVTEGVLPEGIIKLPFNTLKILFDSFLLFKDKDWISEKISPDMVFIKTDFFEEYKEKILTDPNFEKIYNLIDGKRTVGEITQMVDIEDFRVYKLFYALKFLKFIEEKVDEEVPFEPVLEENNVYEIKGDDTENIKMVEELVGEEEEKEDDIAIEFEGVTSEHSAFEEDLNESNQMDSIVLDESDFQEENEEYEKSGEEFEEGNETIAQDKKEYIETLQKQLEDESSIVEEIEQDNFKLEFEKDEENEEEKTIPSSSPYETAKQEIQSNFDGKGMIESNEDSFVVEEEYVSGNGKGIGMYVAVILILFIAALGYLGYNFYKESKIKSKRGYSKPKKTVKIVSSSKDITTEDITVDKIEEKLNENGVTNKEGTTVKNKTENNIKSGSENVNAIEATVTYEAKPVYEEQKTTSSQSTIESDIQNDKYDEFTLNSKTILLENPEAFTIQLELACKSETLDKAIELLPEKDRIFFIPTTFRGNSCFIVCYGIYDTKDEAKVAMETLDKEFFQDNTPLIRKAKKFKKYFSKF
ncbi:hypothetical protein TTHT_0930 [Thermotomaculum hydrothermale]|uniref:PatA-like N-terminal domain-containing protein n=1 Tax=Thermotomaculum hydrothermale TaxID=981385 RepID=A0A7R6SYC3_9BACT|nr:DUF4388 domain-containing protein [Thermotomaculum hydrothermale]BBB32485.1 hypothetical protein TTHT_0930 [Thermotomaculum hydrothermale]